MLQKNIVKLNQMMHKCRYIAKVELKSERPFPARDEPKGTQLIDCGEQLKIESKPPSAAVFRKQRMVSAMTDKRYWLQLPRE
jgi:hypothetical protein